MSSSLSFYVGYLHQILDSDPVLRPPDVLPTGIQISPIFLQVDQAKGAAKLVHAYVSACGPCINCGYGAPAYDSACGPTIIVTLTTSMLYHFAVWYTMKLNFLELLVQYHSMLRYLGSNPVLGLVHEDRCSDWQTD